MNIVSKKVFVGLDYHLNSIQVCVLDSSGKQLVNATRGNDVDSVVGVVPRVPKSKLRSNRAVVRRLLLKD